jgi:hypothetical protein
MCFFRKKKKRHDSFIEFSFHYEKKKAKVRRCYLLIQKGENKGLVTDENYKSKDHSLCSNQNNKKRVLGSFNGPVASLWGGYVPLSPQLERFYTQS